VGGKTRPSVLKLVFFDHDFENVALHGALLTRSRVTWLIGIHPFGNGK
jgi:hypothetical protein